MNVGIILNVFCLRSKAHHLGDRVQRFDGCGRGLKSGLLAIMFVLGRNPSALAEAHIGPAGSKLATGHNHTGPPPWKPSAGRDARCPARHCKTSAYWSRPEGPGSISFRRK
jgi:hypothetical protein